MDEDQKKMIREMVNQSPGWEIVHAYMHNTMVNLTRALIDNNDEQLRGRIKGIEMVMKKVESCLKKDK